MSTVPPLVQYAGFPVEGFDFATSCGDGDPYSGPFRDARCWLPRPVVPFVERLTKALNKAQVDVTAATPPGSWGARRIREVQAPVPGPYFTTDAPEIAESDLGQLFSPAQISATSMGGIWGQHDQDVPQHDSAYAIWIALSWPAPQVAQQLQDAAAVNALEQGGWDADTRLAWHAAEWLRFYGWVFLRHPLFFQQFSDIETQRYFKAVTIRMEELALPATLRMANRYRQNADAEQQPGFYAELGEKIATSAVAKGILFATIIAPALYWLIGRLVANDEAA